MRARIAPSSCRWSRSSSSVPQASREVVAIDIGTLVESLVDPGCDFSNKKHRVSEDAVDDR